MKLSGQRTPHFYMLNIGDFFQTSNLNNLGNTFDRQNIFSVISNVLVKLYKMMVFFFENLSGQYSLLMYTKACSISQIIDYNQKDFLEHGIYDELDQKSEKKFGFSNTIKFE